LRRGWLRLEGAALHRLPRLLLATAIMGSLIAGGDGAPLCVQPIRSMRIVLKHGCDFVPARAANL
jgi:hypothetical protein